MEDNGKIKVSLGALLLIVLIVIVISVGATYLVLQKVNQDKPEKKEENNTVTNSVQNVAKNEVKNEVKKQNKNEIAVDNKVETGAFNNIKVESEGYTIDINSEEVGHPDSESLFKTHFEIENEDGTTETFSVSYEKVFVYGKDAKLSSNTDQPITIDGKRYSYTTKDKHETTLKYHIEDENQAYLFIKVKGMDIFDEDGNDTGTTPIIDEDVLESEELAGLLNFEVEKK